MPTGGACVASAPLTVGADGVRSLVARAVGCSGVRTARSEGSAVLYGYWDDLPARRLRVAVRTGCMRRHDSDERRPDGGLRRHDASAMKAARRAGTGQHAFSTLLQTVSPAAAERVSAAWPPQHLRGFAGMPGYLRQSGDRAGRWSGTPGTFEDPLSTHGITDALRDAELLASAVGDIRDGTATEATALAGYQATRDASRTGCSARSRRSRPIAGRPATLRRLLLDASSAMSEQVEAIQGFDQHDRGERLQIA